MRNNKCIWSADTDKFGMCAAGLAECTNNCPLMRTRHVKTNADRIRAMSDEELSDFLDRVELGDIDYSITFCSMCNGDPKNNDLGLDCDGCRLHWLRQPAIGGD